MLMDEEVDTIIAKCPERIKCLNLSHRLLTVLPKKLSSFNSIKCLLLNDNQLIFPPTEVLTFAHSLTELILDNNKLTVLPAGLGSLRNLQILSVSNNNIGALPSEIGDIETLQELWINQCNLLVVPSEIGKLKYLVRLGLKQNRLEYLPVELSSLISLQWLNCSENNLTDISNITFPEEISFLNLNSNKFESVPDPVKGKRKLKVLLLCGNNICHISDDSLLDLNHVVKLDLRENPMESLPLHWKGMNHIMIGQKKGPAITQTPRAV